MLDIVDVYFEPNQTSECDEAFFVKIVVRNFSKELHQRS